jgi:putative transposase
VFCPKYRHRIFTDELAKYTEQEIRRLLGYKDGVEILELNVQEDHLHLVLWIPPKYSVSSLIGYLKGKSAMKLFQRYERLGRRFWGRHLWGRGYCVSTVGIDEEQIRKYVKWQEKQEKEIERLQGELFDEDKQD